MWVDVKLPHEQNKVSPLQVLEVMELLRVMAAKEPKQWPTAGTAIHRVANQVDLTGDSIAWSIGFVIDVVKQTACRTRAPFFGALFERRLYKVTPEAIVSACAEECDLRSLLLHDLSTMDTRNWCALFDALGSKHHTMARHLKRLDIKFKPCSATSTTSILESAKRMLTRNDRLKQFIVRGCFSRGVQSICDALKLLDRQKYVHPLDRTSKLAFPSDFGSQSTGHVDKSQKQDHDPSSPPYMETGLLSLILTFAGDAFERRVCVVDATLAASEHHVASSYSI